MLATLRETSSKLVDWLGGKLHLSAAADCPASQAQLHEECLRQATGAIPINNIIIPEEVIRQLRQALGTPVHWLTPAELQDAVISYMDDGIVFDDPSGITFQDKLHLTAEELHLATVKTLGEPVLGIRGSIHPDFGQFDFVSFQSRLLQEQGPNPTNARAYDKPD